MRKYMRQFAMFAFYDRVRIEQHLEKMAARGWFLESIGTYFWKYRKEEPKKLHVSVVYVAEASAYDPAPTPGEELLEDLSAENGWKRVLSLGQMQIFCNEQENPVPLETDPVMQVESIHRAMKKHGIGGAWANLGCAIFILLLQGFQFHLNPLRFLTSISIWLVPLAFIMMANSILDLTFWHFWYRKASVAAEQGEFIEIWNHRTLTWILHGLSLLVLVGMFLSLGPGWLFMVLCVVLVLLLVAAVNGLRNIMKESGAKKDTNILVSIIAVVVLTFVMIGTTTFLGIRYHMLDHRTPVGSYQIHSGREVPIYADELPLRIEELTNTSCDKWSLERETSGSFLIRQTIYHQWPLNNDPDVPDLGYIVTEPNFASLYDFCKNEILSINQDETVDGVVRRINHYEPVDPAPWGASEAYQLVLSYNDFPAEPNPKLQNDFILCYEGRIVELHLDENCSINESQMKTVAEKLKP